MKRQIFWLILSCLTATNFLSYTMEEGNTPFKEDENSSMSKEAAGSLETNTNNANKGDTPNITYPAIANDQGLIHWVCEDLKIIKKTDLKKFVGAQMMASTDILMGDGKLEDYLKGIFDDFFKAADQERIKQIWLNLQAQYLPSMVHDSIEDTKMNLLVHLTFEKLIEYAAKNAIESKEKDSFWNDEMTLQTLKFLSDNMPSWTDRAMKRYLKSFPSAYESPTEDLSKLSAADSANKTLALKLAQALNNIKLLEENNTSLNNNIKQLKTNTTCLALDLRAAEIRLDQASSSPGMNRFEGIIFGFGLAFTAYYFLLTVCTSCIDDFQPMPSIAAVFTVGCGIATYLTLKYVHSSKSLPMLGTKIICEGVATFQNSKIKIKNACDKLQALAKIRTPWMIFEDAISKEQIKSLDGNTQVMLRGIIDKDAEKTKEFIEFYGQYCNLVKFKTAPDAETEQKLLNFHDFLLSLDQNQKRLFDKAINDTLIKYKNSQS